MRVILPTVVSSGAPSPAPLEGEPGHPEPALTDAASYAATRTRNSESDIPPITTCATCGDPRCEGCVFVPSHEPESDGHFLIPWEREGRSFRTLTQTAEDTATSASGFFGRFGRGSIGAALGFALLCESGAILAYSLLWITGAFVAFPRLSWHLLTSPLLVGFAATIFLTLVLFVVFVHALAGAALEWSIARTVGTPDYNRGLRMGLYSCGWDLLTSPIGVFLSFRREPRTGLWSLFVAGATVPRRATEIYLRDCRKLAATDRLRAIRTAIFAMILPVLLFGSVLFAGLLWWLFLPFWP